MTSATKPETIKKGRKRVAEAEEDVKQAEIFGKFRATHETMAEHYGCSIRTIERKFEDENNPFCRAYKKGLSHLKMRLSEAQVKHALKGNATLLIWLGKQYLGQQDKQQIESKTELTVEGANSLQTLMADINDSISSKFSAQDS